MAISARAKFLLNRFAGKVSKSAGGLGTLIDSADTPTVSEIALADGKIMVGNASGVGAAVTPTGDVTITNAGVTAIGASKVISTMLTEDIFRVASGTLTQANLLAIGTPISLIAAPGAGKVLIVDEIELFHSYSTTQYATGADVQIEYETAGTNIVLVADTFVTGNTSVSAVMRPTLYDLDGSTGTGVGLDVTALANKGVQVTGSNFTNGHASNVVKWRIRYHILTLLT